MTKFLVLYKSTITGAERIQNADPEQMRASMGAWMKWKEDTGDTLVEFGSPVQIGKHIEDGAVSEGTANFTGYSIIQAESLDAAAEVLKSHPFLAAPGCAIEVLEYLTMPGM